MKALVFIIALSLGGCAVRPASTPTVTQQTELDLNKAVATIAAANRAMVTEAIALNGSGKITDDQTRAALAYGDSVAKAVLVAEGILSGTTTQKLLGVRAAFAGLSPPVVLPPSAGALASALYPVLGARAFEQSSAPVVGR